MHVLEGVGPVLLRSVGHGWEAWGFWGHNGCGYPRGARILAVAVATFLSHLHLVAITGTFAPVA